MKDIEVVFRERNITLKDNPRSVVMDVSSKSLMELYSTIVCQNKGDVLDLELKSKKNKNTYCWNKGKLTSSND